MKLKDGVATDTHLLSHNGRQIAWRETGHGHITLMFIHGWCCTQTSWRYQMDAFGERFRCISLDFAGHGLTSPLAPSSFSSLSDMAADVNILRDACNVDDVILVGHSMGGPVAIEAAAASPSGVIGIVGVDTFTDANMYSQRPMEEISERLAPLKTDFSSSIAGLINMIALVDKQRTDLLSELVQIAISTPLPVALLSMQRLLEWDIERRWQLPDHLNAHAINSKSLVRLIKELPQRPGLAVHLVDEVGHYPMLEDPNAFNAALHEVLVRMRAL